MKQLFSRADLFGVVRPVRAVDIHVPRETGPIAPLKNSLFVTGSDAILKCIEDGSVINLTDGERMSLVYFAGFRCQGRIVQSAPGEIEYHAHVDQPFAFAWDERYLTVHVAPAFMCN